MSTTISDTAATLIDRVNQLTPLVMEHRQAIDRARRLPDAVFEALADAGLFRLWLPKAFGGVELSPHDFMQVVETAAQVDGSVGWVVGNGGGMSRVAGYLPEPMARNWFSHPRAFVTSATGALGSAVPVKGGYRVSGRWPFGSGAHHATHFMGLCSVVDANSGDASGIICCYFTREQVAIADNWHVSGLRGTGSYDFEVRDLIVPSERTHAFPGHEPMQPGVLYRMPAICVFSWTVAVVPLGIAQGAINAFAEIAAKKVRNGTSKPLREREIIQSEFGRAKAQLRAGRALLRDEMSKLIEATDIGGQPLMDASASLNTACTYASESALQVVEKLSAAAGAISISEATRLERCVRDVQAAAKHVAMSPNNYVASGQLGLGLELQSDRLRRQSAI